MNLEALHSHNLVQSLKGKYITLDHIEHILADLNTSDELAIIGKSVLDKPIYSYTIGKGKIKIFLWSQMHGNESTTTKALLDFLCFLKSDNILATQMLDSITFLCLPMLNPDGAQAYTRENANGIDLNRDSQLLSQPESNILRQVFDDFKPDYCFNLHDQRTIFGVADSGQPATLSFLAPSFNEAREINECRLKAIYLIATINEGMQQFLPGRIGRFDDSFNINCIGDTFQFLGVPTLLFEAGHFPNDYKRELSRKFVFMSFILGFKALSENDIVSNGIDKYLNIPQNKVVFYDFIYKNVKINYDGIEKITNFAAQYKEEIVGNQLFFNAYFSKIDELEDYHGHYEYDANGAKYSDNTGFLPVLNQKADFYLDNNIKFVNGMINI
ncbi:zinc carboxypeptidase [Flavobacterium tiangeerense]|uniref:Zinc carboxypeptidase n=1 Tax=Flavobacterium tiangeerense TaxID=459471 RepID=A0ABY3FKD7_9FLAO|nr:M14 metallopeptidase family protein [Flavobacterium tiangeerense]TWI00456.1 zinc carboxypeptidase [Flavobacterium tiangeerense]